jgi:hypothetical protein
VLTTDSFFKERAGLPIAAPHAVRVQMEAPADVERALAPVRFVAADDATDVPRDRVRQVSAFVEEVWTPVYRSTDSTDLATIFRTSQELVGWTVRQRASVSSQARHRLTAEQFVEVLQSAQIQASDEYLNGYYETIPGNDPLIIDGQIMKGKATYDADGRMTHDGTVRGGTMITGGRAEYRAKTKGMVLWDAGVVRERMKAEADIATRPVRNVKANLERKAGEVLPMRRLLANPRVDRRSAV